MVTFSLSLFHISASLALFSAHTYVQEEQAERSCSFRSLHEMPEKRGDIQWELHINFLKTRFMCRQESKEDQIGKREIFTLTEMKQEQAKAVTGAECTPLANAYKTREKQI